MKSYNIFKNLEIVLLIFILVGTFSMHTLAFENQKCRNNVGQPIFNSVKVNDKNFPDKNFRKYILKNVHGANDKKLTEKEASAVTTMNLENLNISDLTGIEWFGSLKELNCNYDHLKNLDVSKNLELESLNCGNNELEELNIENNKKLQNLYCEGNKLQSLDLKNFSNLNKCMCSKNHLSTLSIENNSNLKVLDCSENEIKKLNVHQNKKLEELLCGENSLTSLDVSENDNLKHLLVYENKLTSLDVHHNPKLVILSCSDNQLKTLDCSSNKSLLEIRCDRNKLLTLNIGENKILKFLDCDQNDLITLDVSENKNLEELYCNENHLMSLDLSKNSKLENIECRENELIVKDGLEMKQLPEKLDLDRVSDEKNGIFYKNKVHFIRDKMFFKYNTGYKNVSFTLVKGADYSPVYKAIQKVSRLNRKEYEDFSKVDQTLQKIVVNEPKRKQKEIEKDAKKIYQAVDGLRKKSKLKTIKIQKDSQSSFFRRIMFIGIFIFAYYIFVFRKKEKM